MLIYLSESKQIILFSRSALRKISIYTNLHILKKMYLCPLIQTLVVVN